MALLPAQLVRFGQAVASEGGAFLSLAQRTFKLSEQITDAASTLEKHADKIKSLEEELRALRAENLVMLAKLESIAIRAVADQTGELNRRLGFLEG